VKIFFKKSPSKFIIESNQGFKSLLKKLPRSRSCETTQNLHSLAFKDGKPPRLYGEWIKSQIGRLAG